MSKKLEIDIESMAFGGSGVGRAEGKVCFVDYALPGERVLFTVEAEKKSFLKGRVEEVLRPSADRVKPPCPYYGSCGGCQYQHAAYEKELRYKAGQVKELLERIGGFKGFEFDGIVPSPAPYGYRTSVMLHRTHEGFGFYSRNNRDIVKIDKCLIAAEPINAEIGKLTAAQRKNDVTLKCDYAGKVWITDYPGHRFFKDKFSGKDIFFSPRAFSQANRAVSESIVGRLRGWISAEKKREVLFDLYSGVGFFAFLLGDLFDKVIGMEENGVSVDCAKASKKLLGAKDVKFFEARVEDKFEGLYESRCGRHNIVILDPPRAGAGEGLLKYLADTDGIGTIYYISCDPAILARDAKRLAQDGSWRLSRIACFDMFPRTAHIESIAVFRSRLAEYAMPLKTL